MPIMYIGRGKSTLNRELENKQFLADGEWISLSEIAKFSPYSAEYLSLLARKGRLTAKKINGVWHTTRAILEDYLRQQIARAELQNKNPDTYRTFVSEEKPVEAISQSAPVATTVVASPIVSVPQVPTTQPASVLQDKEALFTEFMQNFNAHIDERVEEQHGFLFGITRFIRRSYQTAFSSKKMVAIFMVLLVLSVISPVRFVSGFAENFFRGAMDAVKDAQTVMGFRPGTHENEILLLGPKGEISIFGNVETEGQFRSFVEDGIAPIVVTSRTKVENLNADLIDGLETTAFTLAFVTKNGNVTYEDVYLQGKVEVGSTLLVRGATKLLESLSVDGELSVMGDALFNSSLTVLGESTFKDTLTATEIIAQKSFRSEGESTFERNATFERDLYGQKALFEGKVSVYGDFNANSSASIGGSGYDVQIISETWSVNEDGFAQFQNLSVADTTTLATVNVSGVATFSGDVSLVGALIDSLSSQGDAGEVLLSTGTSTMWVATSTLGIISGGSGTVTSVSQTVPTGFVVSGSPITTSGTLAISYDVGYEGLKTASSTEWATAYSWGDHALAGYLLLADIDTSAEFSAVITDETGTGNIVFSQSPTLTGNTTITNASTTNLSVSDDFILAGLGGGLECLQADANGVVSKTGFGCGSSSGGLVALNGLTASSQSFATSTSGGIDLVITSDTSTHTFTANPSSGYLIPLTASTTEWAVAYASTTNLTPAYIRGLLSNTATGLTYDSGTGVTALTAGYTIPLSASTTAWNTFYNTPSTQITAGTNLAWSGNTLNGTFGTSSARASISESITGIDYNNISGDFSLTSGYTIPTTASTSEWAAAYASTTNISPSYIRGLFSATSPLAYNSTTGDFSVASGYSIPLTASTTEWATAYGWGDHSTVGYLTPSSIDTSSEIATIVTDEIGTGRLVFASSTALTTPTIYGATLSGTIAGGTFTGGVWNGTDIDVSDYTNLAVGATGLELSNDTIVLTAGYIIPTVASTTEWAAAYASTTNVSPSYIRSLFSNTVAGLTYDDTTGETSLTAGYTIPLSASTTAWNTFYNTPSTQITAGTNLAWSGNTLNGTFGTSSARASISESITGIDYNNTTGDFSLTSGYTIPTTASTSEWATAYSWGDHSAAGYLTDITGESLEDLSDVDSFTQVAGDILYWTGTGWNVTSTSTWSSTLSEAEVEDYIFDVDNTGTLSSGTLALDSLTYTGTLDDANINDAISLIGGTIGTSTISGTLTTSGTLTIGDGGDRIDVASNTWDVVNGVISGATWQGAVIDEVYGGTGQNAYATGDILYANSANNLTRLPISSNGLVLKITGGVPTWSTDLTSVGGGGGVWATTSDDGAIYPVDTSDVVIIGSNATSSAGYMLEVVGGALFDGITVQGDTTLINASTTNLSVSGNSYLGTVTSGTWNGSDIDVSDYTNLAVSATGLTLSNDTIALTAGYTIPLSASTTAWNTFYNTPSTQITAGTNLAWSGNTLNGTFGTSSARASISESITGIDYNNTTGDFSLTSGYTIPLTASTTQWNAFLNASSTYATGTNFWGGSTGGAIYSLNSGNVGIGTSTPSATLHVQRAGSFTGSVTSDVVGVFGNTTAAGTNSSLAVVSGSTGLASLYLGGDGSTSYNNGRVTYSASTNSLGLFTSDTEKLTILSGGNVGIGDTTPASLFTVGANDAFQVSSLGVVASGTWNGSDIDVSDYTNLAVSATGLTLSNDTIALTAGYTIPLSASTTAWNTFYNTPSTQITAGTNLAWSGNTLNGTFGTSSARASISESITGIDYNNTTGDFSLTSGYTIPTTASTSEWSAAFASSSSATPSYIRSLFSNTVAGLTYDSGTGETSLTAGYTVPLSASTTAWQSFYTTPSTRITAGDGIDWSSNTLNVNDVTAAMLAAADFGDFTCNGTTCALDADVVSDNEIDYTTVTLADFTNDAGFLLDITGSSFLDLFDTPASFTANHILYMSGSAVTSDADLQFDGTTFTATNIAGTNAAITNATTTNLYATTLNLANDLSVANGGTGASTLTGLLIGNGTSAFTATTTSAGLASVISNETGTGNVVFSASPTFTGTANFANASTTNLSVSGNSYLGTVTSGTWNGSDIDVSDYTNLAVSATGLTLSNDTIALTAGYTIPLSASTTAWNTFYNTPSTQITAGTNLAWSGNTLNGTFGTSSARASISESITGIDYNNSTGDFSLTSGYTIPLTASTTQWNNFINSSSTYATGTNLWAGSLTGNIYSLNSGNVGVGTSTPAEKFSIDSGSAEYAFQWNSNGSKSWVLGSASNRTYIRNKTDGTEPLTVLNGGNVGIGDTSPASLFTVGANDAFQVSSLGVVASGTWNGSDIDISDYTNLAVSGTGLSLSGDTVALTAGYTIPLSASTTEWTNFYNTPSTRITAGDGIDWTSNTLNVNDVTAAMLIAGDFGDFTCNGTTCALDADTVSDSEIDYTTVTLADFTNDAGYLLDITGSSFLDLFDTPSSYTANHILYMSGSAVTSDADLQFDGTTFTATNITGTNATITSATTTNFSTTNFNCTDCINATEIEDIYVLNTGDSISGNLTFSGSSANIVLGSNYLSGDGGDEGVFVSSAGLVGIGTASPTEKLSVLGSVIASTNETDTTTKQGLFGVKHYTNAEEPFYGVHHYTDATNNILYLGGGTSGGNAATSIRFHTAANSTTTTGTLQMVLTSSGSLGIGDTTPASMFTVGSGDLFQVNSSGAIAAATGITSTGTINFGGLTASRLVATDASKNLVSTITLANLVASISDVTSSTGTTNLVLSGSPTIVTPTFTTNISLGTAGVRLSDDGDGAITFLGLGNGSDEDLTLNLDDTANTGVFTSSTGLNVINFSGIALQESGSAVLSAADIDTCAEFIALVASTGTCGSAVFSVSPTFTGTVNAAAATLSSTLTMSGTAANIALGSNYLSGDGGDEGVFVSSTGLVGIGTSTVTQELTLEGDFQIGESGGQVNGMGVNADGQLLFYRNAVTNNQVAMTIDDDSGNIGIGTTTPSQMLSVGATTGSQFLVTSAGVVTDGSWTADTIADDYGGTGFSTYATGDMLYASGANTLAKRTIGSTGDILSVVGGVPTWVATSTLGFVTSASFDTSAELAAILSDETGTAGSVVFSASPTLTGTLTAAAANFSGAVSASSLTLTTDLAVADGGTGASSLTDGGVLLGSGTGAITAMAVLGNGAIIVGDGTTDPVALTAFTSSTGDLIHEAGGLEADVSGYTNGLYGMISSVTTDIDTYSELNSVIGDVTLTHNGLIDTSAEIAAIVTDELGTGRLVFASSTALTTPTIYGATLSGTISGGTFTGGTWNGGVIGEVYGGTGQSTYATGDMLYASGANTLAKRTIGSTGNILSVVGGVPTWVATSTLGFLSTSTMDTCAEFAAIMTDETGTCGGVVLSVSPTLTGTLDAVAGDFSSTLTMSGTAANIALGSNYLSGDGGDEGIFVDGDGNVGIGNSTPNASLEILSTKNFDPASANASSTLKIRSTLPGALDEYGANLLFGKGNSGRPGASIASVQTTSDDDQIGLAFFTHNSSASTEILVEMMRLTHAGNLGIGDTTPASMFTVGSGDLFQVNSSGAIAAATGITSTGTINFGGLTASRLVATDASKNLVSTITLANLVASVSDVTSSTGSTNLVLSGSPTIVTPTFTTNISLGTAGVRLSDDGDGAITFLGLGNGSDEDLTLNLDDTANTGVFTSSTGLNVINFSGIALQESGSAVLSAGELDTCAEFAALGAIETGSCGSLVFSVSPTLTGTTSVATLTASGNITTAGEFISTTANQARFIAGNYGLIHRNDGSNYYLLLTASGDQYGSWNSLRPFRINNVSGLVTMEEGLEVTGSNIEISGSTAPSLVLDASSGSDYVIGANTVAVGMGIYDSTASTWRLFVEDTTGDIGIGTVSPASRLDIDSASNTSALTIRGLAETAEIGEIYMGNVGQMVISTVSGTDTGGLIEFRPEDDQYGLLIRESDGTGTGTYANFYVVDAADDYLTIGLNSATGGTDELVVTAAGLVGVGTATPDTTFHVEGDLTVGGTTLYFEDSGGGGSGTLTRTIQFNNNDAFTYNDTDNSYSFEEDGTTRVLFDLDDLNFGFGTTTPQNLMHLVSGGGTVYDAASTSAQIDTNASLIVHNTSNTQAGFSQIILGQRTSSMNLMRLVAYGGTAANFGLVQNAVENFTVLGTTGYVGIGTTAPDAKLDIEATSSGTTVDALVLSNSVGSVVNTGVALHFQPNGAASLARTARIVSRQTTAGNYADLGFFTAGADTPAERLTIMATGNVGIGDTTPASMFTVGSGDLFQVNSSGAIAAATGITSTGTINFGGLTASRLVATDASKNLVSTLTLANLVASLSDVTSSTGSTNLVLSASPTFTGTITAAAANFSGAVSASSLTLTTDLAVADGGTGASSLTDGGILLGSGTGAITAMAVLGNGAIVVGDGTTDPVALTAFTSSTGDLIHEAGGLEADVSAYTGLLAVSGGVTSEVDSAAEFVAQIADISGVTGTGNLVLSASPTLTGTTSMASLTVSGTYTANATATRDKIRVWNSATYTIGMMNTFTYGYLNNDYAMTFQMNADADRGFWWGADTDTVDQGAMSLTTDGRLYVDSIVNVGDGIILNSSGTLGIGTTTPSENLSVVSADNTSTTNIFAVRSLNLTQGVGIGYNEIRSIGTNTNNDFAINAKGTGDLLLQTTATGNVGVGYSAPATRLDIDAASNSTGLRIRGLAETVEIADLYVGSSGELLISTVSGTDTGAFIDMRSEDNEYGLILRESDGTGTATYANLYVTDASDDYLTIGVNSATGGTDELTVTASGKVGIGTTTPVSKLTLEETTDPTFAFSRNDTTLVGGDILGQTTFYGNDASAGRGSQVWAKIAGIAYDPTGDAQAINTSTGEGGALAFYTGIDTASSTNFTLAEKMRLTPEGKLGLGSTTPASYLTIDKNWTTAGEAMVSINTGGTVGAAAVTGLYINAFTSGSGYTATVATALDLEVRKTDDFLISAGISSGGAEAFRVRGDGYVGIGTTTLERNLNISASDANMGLKLSNSGAVGREWSIFSTNSSGLGGVGGLFVIYDDTGANDRLTIDSSGNVGLGDLNPSEARLVVGNAGNSNIYLTLDTAGTTNNAVCWDNAGATLLYDCDGTPADYAESYPTVEGTEYGEIMMATEEMVLQTDGTYVPRLAKAVAGMGAVIGITSDNYHDFTSAGQDLINDEDHPLPVALNGRVPVKVNMDGGPIEIGDIITVSSEPGVGTRATTTAQKVGIALESADEEGVVLVFVENGLHIEPDFLTSMTRLDMFAEGTDEKLIDRLVVLAENFVDGVLRVAGIRTDELCVGNVCVDESTFLQMVQNAGGTAHALEEDGDDEEEVPPPPTGGDDEPVDETGDGEGAPADEGATGGETGGDEGVDEGAGGSTGGDETGSGETTGGETGGDTSGAGEGGTDGGSDTGSSDGGETGGDSGASTGE